VDEKISVMVAGQETGQSRVSLAWRSFVPEHVVKTLLEHPTGMPVASAEPTEAVVLFADVVGFTPMSEALAAAGSYGTEELTRILNGWFDSMVGLVSRYGGSVAEVAGDGLIAVFPYERRTRRPTERRAVQCALDMHAAVGRFERVTTRAGTFGVAMRVGLAAGPLLMTIMGDPTIRLEPVLAGEALDRAATAEHHARSGEILVDGALLDDDLGIEVTERRDGWNVVGGLRPRASAARWRPAGDLEDGAAARLVPFLHPAIAERLRSGWCDLVNEHRKVAVAFVGLPRLAADHRQAVAQRQRWLTAAVRLIDRYGGHLHQIATDANGSLLVVSFGAPVSHEDDEERAISCCLELLRLSGEQARAGVTTGSAFCGQVGSDIRRTYTVIGDSVNLAARLMQAAAPGQLLVDRATRERVKETVVHHWVAPLAVKGKARPVQVWEVSRPRDRPRIRLSNPAWVEPLVGRSDEIAVLRVLAEQAHAGRGQVVGLTGEAGIGKSRLAAEVMRSAKELGFDVHRGACRSHGTTTSYLVWRSIWRDLLEIDVAKPIAEQQAQLASKVAAHDAGSDRRAPLLAPVLNVPMPDSELTEALDPKARDELLRSLLLDLLRERTTAGPLLLQLEDCHWIDPASLALLQWIARGLAGEAALIIVSARSTRDPSPLASLSTLPHCTQIELRELNGADAEQLVTRRLARRYGSNAAFDPAVVQRLAEHGEGNPFYLEELVSYLHVQGIEPRDASVLARFELPDGLQRLVMARIDQLGEGEKTALKVASVLGRRFRAGWIAGTFPAAGTPAQIAGYLERLEQLELAYSDASGVELEYSFKHAITQEAAYQSLTFELREALHERVARYIEREYAGRLDQFVDVLAHHYGNTRLTDKQRVWFRMAGDAAKAAFANEAAVSYYERLLPLLPDNEVGAVLMELGSVRHLTGAWKEAERVYRGAMEVASRTGDRTILAASQRDLGDLFMYTQSYHEAVRWLTRAANEFEQLGDQPGLSKALDRVTFALWQQGAYDQALAAAERHLAIATEAGDLAGVSIALNHTGLVCLNTGDTAAARALLLRALDAANRSGDRRCLLHAANNLALVHMWRGEHTRAVASWRQALSVAQEIGHRQTAGVIVGNLGELYREQGDYARASKCFTHALRIAAELGDWTSVAHRVVSLATTAVARGQDLDAERFFARAVALARFLDAPYVVAYSLHHQAQLYAAQGRLEAAELLNEEALKVAVRNNEGAVRMPARLLSVRLSAALGRIQPGVAIERLRALQGEEAEPHERAALLEEIWRLDPTDEAARQGAADLYQSLHADAPIVAYREAYARLTGVELPPGPPLPPPPPVVEQEVVDVEALLREIDQTARQVGAA
jgi:class 3 adenylate cyclase/tetratricopeptide (TPR) repeat protein